MDISGADCNPDLVTYLLFWVLDMAEKPKFCIVHKYYEKRGFNN